MISAPFTTHSIAKTEHKFMHKLTINKKIFPNLSSTHNLPTDQVSIKNCENLIGSVVIPVGIAGPLPIFFDNKKNDVTFPLATTEGALVASVNRGCKALRLSGGVKVYVTYNGITRAPVFFTPSTRNALGVKSWLESKSSHNKLKLIAEKTSQHLEYLGCNSWIRGRHIYVRFVFDTDEAMGMNMATIASNSLANFICQQFPQTKLVALSSNVCTDKKDSVINSLYGRGYWVQAESFISNETLNQVLKVKKDDLIKTHIQKNLIGSNLAGSLSQNSHVANILSAIYLATGQDPAHVVDGSKASLTIETEEDGVYVAVTIPSIIVGVIGGGTYLPSQTESRKLIGDGKDVSAKFLAASIGAASLAGELSLLASLTTNTLAQSHQKLARSK